MKLKQVKITVKNRTQASKNFAEVLYRARKGEDITPHYEVSFENIEALRKVLTEKRLELLHVIKEQNPDSIYELAQLVDRDINSVKDDIHVLEELGLISLEEIHEARRRVRPLLEFDRIQVEIAV